MLRNHDIARMLLARRKARAQTPELWQFDLLSAKGICSFANERGIQVLQPETIQRLWQVGLIRAELVRSDHPLTVPGLELIAEEQGEHSYFDSRGIPFRKHGYGACFQDAATLESGIELSFHPFRAYVLYHVDRVFRSDVSSTQYLAYPGGFATVTQHEVDHLNRWTGSQEFVDRFEDWNRTAELAIVMEPTAYERIFGVLRWRSPDNESSMRAKLDSDRAALASLMGAMSAPELNEVRRALCIDAETIDRNKLLHVLLRLMSTHEQLKLRDGLGLSMLFLSMAEVLRRAFENARGVEMAEEDEMGFGQWMEGARKTVYGTERILDAVREVRRDFLTSMGLDSGIKVRCYVEGYSERGALVSAVGNSAGTQFVNLAGQVVERHGQDLRFVESLKSDRQLHVFSVVVLDKDRADNVRAIKKAARDGNFFGRFFVSDPDFEFANFTLDELLDTANEIVSRGTTTFDMPSARTATAHTRSGRAFLSALQQLGFARVGKSEAWGAALMERAIKVPLLPAGHARQGAVRPIVEVARLLVRARNSGYVRSIENLVVDPETGELRKPSGD